MKKFISILCLFISISENSYSNTSKNTTVFKNPPIILEEDCDACGCSANGGSMGTNSLLNNHFIGIRHIHQSYKSKEGIFNNSPWAKETFNTIQVWSRIPISNKVEISTLIPYHFNERIKTNETQKISGIGDISLLGFYNLVQEKDDLKSIYQKLQIGAGVKLPTGRYDKENNNSVNPSFQLGTGSWDYTIATEYTLQKKKYGLNLNTNYIFKTENNKNYQFGNQFNYSVNLFYNTQIKNIVAIPQAGILGEVYATNKEWGIEVPKTSGDILFYKMGIELGFKKFSFGTNIMLPITQNLTGKQVEARYRWAFNFNYVL